MPRKRMIDPSFWRDEKIAQCTHIERLLFIGLWNFSEDSGVGRANPLLIKADVFPYDTLREADIQKSLVKLASLGLILLYEIDGQQYYFITNFAKHQTINRPSKCSLPTPLPEHSLSTHGALMSEDKEKLREDNNSSEQMPEPVASLPLNDGSEHGITQAAIDEWQMLYPAVNIMQELRNMRGWCIANPKKRKTKTGISRFINSWLSKCQDKGGGLPKGDVKYLV